MSPSWTRDGWAGFAAAVGSTAVCHVCAKTGGHSRSSTTIRWVCWDCRDALIAQKALCGAHVTGTYHGPDFSDGSSFLGFFVD